MKKRFKRLIILCGLALLVGAGIGWFEVQRKQAPATVQQGSPVATPVAGVQIGGPYELIDHTGVVRTEADFADDYKLIYFGFTYCPAICPTELAKITAALAQLPEEQATKIQPLFITVDPARDSVEVMADYVSLFDDRLIGLTGSQDQIDAVKKAYRVYARQVEDPDLNDYTVDHSSYIYFMSPDDVLLGMYRIKDTPAYILSDIINLLE